MNSSIPDLFDCSKQFLLSLLFLPLRLLEIVKVLLSSNFCFGFVSSPCHHDCNLPCLQLRSESRYLLLGVSDKYLQLHNDLPRFFILQVAGLEKPVRFLFKIWKIMEIIES